MKNIPIVELYLIKQRLLKEGMGNDPFMDDICNAIKEKERRVKIRIEIDYYIVFTF